MLRAPLSARDFQSIGPLGRFTMPAAGRAWLRVSEPRRALGPWPYLRTGGYSLAVTPIDRRPELRPFHIAIGDTIDGETIDPAGDIDEFVFDGIMGHRVVGLFDTPLGLTQPGMVLEGFAQATGALLGRSVSFTSSPTFGDTRTAPFTLPMTGAYLVRIRNLNDLAYEGGPYRFAIVPDS